MKLTLKYIFPFLILLNSIMSINQWSIIPLGNTTIMWIVNFAIVFIILAYKERYFKPINKKDYLIITIYFIWLIIGIIRGIFVAENYWEWKQLITGTLCLLLPILVYVFVSPSFLRFILKFWVNYAFPIFFLFIYWVVPRDVYHFYLGPVLVMACFLPILKKKWQFLFFALLILMIFADFGARSQIIKSVAAILMSVAYLFGKYMSDKILKITHWFLYILPIVLISLGIIGTFNVFEDFSTVTEKNISGNKSVSEEKSSEMSADTRTFIYVEVIESALKNDYVIMGRTPARGNDSVAFGEFNAEELKTGKYERHSNEVCFPNIFTWLGLIGMIFYCLIYLKSSYLALYKSNNLFMKLIGVYIAFRFLLGWIEDFNRFDISNIALWMVIAMGFSKTFRKMNDREFKACYQAR